MKIHRHPHLDLSPDTSMNIRTISCFLALSLLPPAFVSAHEPKKSKPEADPAPTPEIAALTALTRQPTTTAADWIRLGDALMQLQRDQVGHDFTAAAKAYQEALKRNPKHAEAMVGMAWVANSNHDFKSGAEWAEKALAIDPDIHDAHALLGDGAVELGDYDAAFNHYEDAVNLRADLSSYSRSAHLLWLTGNAAHAQAFMQKAIDAGGPYPENTAWCRAELALMQFNAGALLAAAQQAEKAVAQAPRNPRALNILARIRMAQERFPEALECFEKSTAITPNHDALAGIVDIHTVSGNGEMVKAAISKVLAFHEGHTHDHHDHEGHHAVTGDAQLARFLADHGLQPARAVKEAEAAFKTYKNIPVTDTLAWAYHKNGENEKARRTILRIKDWNTPDPRIHYHLGMIQHASGNREAARKALSTALSLNPKFHPTEAKAAADTLDTLAQAARTERLAATPSSAEKAKAPKPSK